MEKLAKRIRNSNQQYFDAGVDAGTQKACDLLLVAAYECGFIRTPEKAKKLMETLTQLESEYGVAWQCRPESDEAIARIDYVLKKVCRKYECRKCGLTVSVAEVDEREYHEMQKKVTELEIKLYAIRKAVME